MGRTRLVLLLTAVLATATGCTRTNWRGAGADPLAVAPEAAAPMTRSEAGRVARPVARPAAASVAIGCAAPADACAPVCEPAPTFCGLPCENGRWNWRVRAVGGYPFQFGDDAGETCCLYLGADFGRNFCGTCLAVEGFYRTHGEKFDVEGYGVDAGRFHHVGVKAYYERSFNQSKFYWWAGIGPEYFWTQDYLDNDSGFGIYAELGVGYVLAENWRVRAGLNMHADYTSVARNLIVDSGKDRWLFTVAPTVSIEFDFDAGLILLRGLIRGR